MGPYYAYVAGVSPNSGSTNVAFACSLAVRQTARHVAREIAREIAR